jgi:hypothetical protein
MRIRHQWVALLCVALAMGALRSFAASTPSGRANVRVLNLAIRDQRVASAPLLAEIEQLQSQTSETAIPRLLEIYSSREWLPYLAAGVQTRIIDQLSDRADGESTTALVVLLQRERREGRTDDVHPANDYRYNATLEMLFAAVSKAKSSNMALIELGHWRDAPAVLWMYRQRAVECLLLAEMQDALHGESSSEHSQWLLVRLDHAIDMSGTEWTTGNTKTEKGLIIGALTKMLLLQGELAREAIQETLDKGEERVVSPELRKKLQYILRRIQGAIGVGSIGVGPQESTIAHPQTQTNTPTN